MAHPWSVLGLRKGSDAEQLWRAYAKSIRQIPDEGQRRRARDAFEAIELGLWGRFADSVDPHRVDSSQRDRWAYEGPLASELCRIDNLLAGTQPIDEMAVRDQIEALFEHPEFRKAEIYLHVEPALAALLESHLPHSEPFIPFALEHFHHITDQARQQPVVARLLDRADELELLDTFDSGGAELSSGWRALKKSASPWQRWLWARSDRRDQVAALYAYAGWQSPGFRHRMDAGEWAWWSKELSHERTSFRMLLAWLLAAILMGVAANQYQAPPMLAAAVGASTFAFLWIDSSAARALIARRGPRPLDGPGTLIFACAALALPVFTRLLPPDWLSSMIVAGLALVIGWGLRHVTGLPGGARSSAWLDSTALPVLGILFFALSLPIPWERYAMLASYAWLLHAVLPQLRRAVTMSLDRLATLPWSYLSAGLGALFALIALFAAELDINRESTRMALLITGYALVSQSVYFSRPFPSLFALLGCAAIGGYLVIYCQGGGEYHPGPAPSAGETLLSAERGDVIDWKPFPANGEEILERMKRHNPEAHARLMEVIGDASCDRGRDGGRECEAYSVDGAIYAEVGKLVPTMSSRHLAEWTRLEARVREAQFRSGSGACSALAPQFSKLDPTDIRHDHGALVLDIIASGPRPPSERPNVALPDLQAFERVQQAALRSVTAIEGGPVDARLRQACINQLVRARTILSFDTDIAARISRGGYPQ